MKKRLYTFLFASILASSFLMAQLPVKVQPIPVGEVRLTDSPFKHAEDMDIDYLLGLDADRLAAPYLKGVGVQPRAENYPNWENTGLDGHVGGHYLSALAFMYAATGNARIKERLDYFVSELKRAQDAAGDGYLCGTPDGRQAFADVANGKIDATSFGLNGKWVPLYNIHKTYAGLRDAYMQGENEVAKSMFLKLTDWMMAVVGNLSDEQVQDMLRSEHGGLCEVFADAAAISGNKKYLALAHRFSHQAVLQPLLAREDKLTGMHANTQIPKVVGFKRIADLEGNKAWADAAQFFWQTVVEHRSISIGGNSVREHFHPANDFSSMMTSEQGPETCNTYNMLRLTKLLYQTSADTRYIDYYERALYNHILSTQDPVQGGFVYFTPMRPGHYRVYSQPQTSFWCCVGSGLENHARYGEMIYGSGGDALYVNLFIPSVIEWKEQGVRVEQQNRFPQEPATTLIVTPRKDKAFTLNVRIPSWTTDARMTVNGQPVQPVVEEGYMRLSRIWHAGDRVRVELPMHLQAEALPDHSANYSFVYGPIVLAARMGKDNQTGLFADDGRGSHIASGERLPLTEAPVIVDESLQGSGILSHVCPVDGKPFTFTLTGLSPVKYNKGLTLEPFYQLYETRYAVYFPAITPQALLQREEQTKREEAEMAATDIRTVDRVVCGEQQPESDHAVQMEQSFAGTDDVTGRHWRVARGWFSYQLKRNGKEVTKLRIACRISRNSNAKVFVNGAEVGIIGGNNASADRNFVVEFQLPAGLRQSEVLEVKIARGDGEAPVTPGIYEVRLMN